MWLYHYGLEAEERCIDVIQIKMGLSKSSFKGVLKSLPVYGDNVIM